MSKHTAYSFWVKIGKYNRYRTTSVNGYYNDGVTYRTLLLHSPTRLIPCQRSLSLDTRLRHILYDCYFGLSPRNKLFSEEENYRLCPLRSW